MTPRKQICCPECLKPLDAADVTVEFKKPNALNYEPSVLLIFSCKRHGEVASAIVEAEDITTRK